MLGLSTAALRQSAYCCACFTCSAGVNVGGAACGAGAGSGAAVPCGVQTCASTSAVSFPVPHNPFALFFSGLAAGMNTPEVLYTLFDLSGLAIMKVNL